MSQERHPGRSWPEWLSALRQDDLARARLKRSILEAAGPLLRRRQLTWWEVASDWASLLTPVAAAIAVLFVGLALESGPEPEPAVVAGTPDAPRLEELVDWASAEELPRAFAEDSLTNLDVVLTSITTEP